LGKITIIFFWLFHIALRLNSQSGALGTITANNSRGSAPNINVGATPNLCVNVGSLKSGIVQVRNLSASTMDNYIASEGCFVNTHSSSTIYKNMWFTVTIPAGSSVAGLFFFSTLAGTQPTSSTNIRTAYLNVFTGTSACAPALVCSNKMDNIIMSYKCCSSPYLNPYGTRRVDVTAGTTYFIEVWTLSTSTDPNYNFNIEVVPVSAHQANEACSNSLPYLAGSTNCNLGAYPSCNAYVPSCWGTIDNSVFFKFTRPAGSSFNININSVTCQGGGGNLQAAVFAANTSNCTTNLTGANMKDCDANTGNMTLTVTDALAAGTEYILWLDGEAGAACSWGLTILDVDLISFDVVDVNELAKLNWVVSSEKNNSHYIIEKSKNGYDDFELVGTIYGAGNSNAKKTYEFTDYNTSKGLIYYRLSQVNFDGTTNIKGLKSFEKLKTQNNFNLSFTPNPFQDELTINIEGESNGTIQILVYNHFSTLVKEIKENLSEEKILVNTKDMTPGYYFVTALFNGQQKHYKLIKQ
jgi:hypothetical protein